MRDEGENGEMNAGTKSVKHSDDSYVNINKCKCRKKYKENKLGSDSLVAKFNSKPKGGLNPNARSVGIPEQDALCLH